MASIFDQLKEQSQIVVDKIYGIERQFDHQSIVSYTAPWACKAVFQSLSMPAKVMVMKLLMISGSISADDLYGWLNPTNVSTKLRDSIFHEILSLRILVPELENEDEYIESYSTVNKSSEVLYFMNPHFRSSFKIALSTPSEPWGDAIECNNVSSTTRVSTNISVELLDSFSRDRWSFLLSYLVGVKVAPSVASTSDASSSRRKILIEQFTTADDLMRGDMITSQGYEYLLKSYRDQVWQYVKQVAKNCPLQDEALSLLFMLSYCELHTCRGYPLNRLTQAQQRMVLDLYQLGIVYIPADHAEYLEAELDQYGGTTVFNMSFYPTRIAVSMIFGNDPSVNNNSSESLSSSSSSFSSGLMGSMQDMNIIVETNHQVVAYISCELHLALLKLFVEVHLHLPNMAMGRITKEHSKKAFRMGIKAAQVIDFLIMHAHPLVRSKKNIIPDNVTDQLALWEAENYRIKTQDAVVIECREAIQSALLHYNANTLNTPDVFDTLEANLKKVDLLLWVNKETMIIAIPPVDNYIRVVQSYIESSVASAI